MSSQGISREPKTEIQVLDKKGLLSLQPRLSHDFMYQESERTNFFSILILEHKDTREKNAWAESLRCLEFKTGELKWRRPLIETYFLPFVTGWSNFFAQCPFFNKCQKAKCVLPGIAFIGEKAQYEKSDSSSFAELGSLVKMNDKIKFTWVVVRGSN